VGGGQGCGSGYGYGGPAARSGRSPIHYASAHCMTGLERIHGPGVVGRSVLQVQGAVLYRVALGYHDVRRIIKNAELAHLLYIDERERRSNLMENRLKPVGMKFVYNCVGYRGFNCENFVMACRDGVFEEFVIQAGLKGCGLHGACMAADANVQQRSEMLILSGYQTQSELADREAFLLTSRIAQIDGYQASGWQLRVASSITAVSVWYYLTSQATSPWALTIGSTVLVGELTLIYAVADVAFTTVDIAQDYYQVSDRRMSVQTFQSNVWKKLTWCGIRIVSFMVRCVGSSSGRRVAWVAAAALSRTESLWWWERGEGTRNCQLYGTTTASP